jgi:hypothetical protein
MAIGFRITPPSLHLYHQLEAFENSGLREPPNGPYAPPMVDLGHWLRLKVSTPTIVVTL